MSTAAGSFFGEQSMVYVAGAPRGNGTGQVVLFTKISKLVNLMDIKLVISGEQLASNFGYELATADLNGDKLVVICTIFYKKSLLFLLQIFIQCSLVITYNQSLKVIALEKLIFNALICTQKH